MKNRNLILFMAIMLMLLVACDNEKQPVAGDNLEINNSGDIVEVIENWLSAEFLGGRHETRVNMIER